MSFGLPSLSVTRNTVENLSPEPFRSKHMLLASAPNLRVPAASVHRTTLFNPLRCTHWTDTGPTLVESYPTFKTSQYLTHSMNSSFLASSKAATPKRTDAGEIGLITGMGVSPSIRRDW